jgi:SAM-dependent methyltransferase
VNSAQPDAAFANPRLAGVYDLLDGERSDLEVYAAIVEELGAESVLDIGCGTGAFSCLLAARGVHVTGVDPARASLAVAQRKPGADQVHWLHGDATELPPMQGDMAVMTGNVAQVFVRDAEWAATLRGVHGALRPGGRLVFETRDPAREAWLNWTKPATLRRRTLPGGSEVTYWIEGTVDNGGVVTFRQVYEFSADGAVLTSDSTLRFRSRAEVTASLEAAGFRVDEIRDAPDRPGLELVFIASGC